MRWYGMGGDYRGWYGAWKSQDDSSNKSLELFLLHVPDLTMT